MAWGFVLSSSFRSQGKKNLSSIRKPGQTPVIPLCLSAPLGMVKLSCTERREAMQSVSFPLAVATQPLVTVAEKLIQKKKGRTSEARAVRAQAGPASRSGRQEALKEKKYPGWVW